MADKQLTEKQRRFVEAYMGAAEGNATQAARLAGYKAGSAHVTGARLLRNAKISRAIKARQEADPLVATREERQQFWTKVMKGEAGDDISWRDRLKASELLGKSCADFKDRVEVEGNMTASINFYIPTNGRDNP